MLTIDYPDWFEDLWMRCNALKTRSLGSRSDAYKAVQKLKMDSDDVDHMVQCFRNQTDTIRRVRATGNWIEDHMNLSGWLNQRRFEDEISEPTTTEALPKSDQRKAEAARRYRAKHMGDGVEPPGSDEASVGGIGQHDLRILEDSS